MFDRVYPHMKEDSMFSPSEKGTCAIGCPRPVPPSVYVTFCHCQIYIPTVWQSSVRLTAGTTSSMILGTAVSGTLRNLSAVCQIADGDPRQGP